MTGCERDLIGRVALRPELLTKLAHASVGASLIFTVRVVIYRRAQQSVQQHIARHVIGVVHVRHPLFKLHMTLQTELRRCGRRQANKIRLYGTGNEYGVGITRHGFTEVVLQLANLVAAKGESSAIIAFYPESCASERLREAW